MPDASARRPMPVFARHSGVAASLFRGAHDLALQDPQRGPLDAIETNLKADDEGLRTAMKAFRTDLLAGVRIGKLDAAKLTADDGVVDQAIVDHQAKEAQALDALHTLLDAPQRTTLIASVRARQAQREARTVSWMLAKDADGGAPDWAKKRADRLTGDLALDADQQKQVTLVLTKANDPPNAAGMKSRWDDAKKRTDALLTAFEGDAFDAKTVDLTILPGKTAHDSMDHMDAFFSKLLPILHPDQREKLATKLDKPFGFGGGMQGRGPADDIVFPFEEPIDMGPHEPSGLGR